MFLQITLLFVASLAKNYTRFLINLSSHLWCSIYCENRKNFAHNADQNFLWKFCKERNVFISAAPIRRSLNKKLHKVSHQFSCGLRPCKIVRTVKNIAYNVFYYH